MPHKRVVYLPWGIIGQALYIKKNDADKKDKPGKEWCHSLHPHIFSRAWRDVVAKALLMAIKDPIDRQLQKEPPKLMMYKQRQDDWGAPMSS